jgi:hypothetical protein
VTTEADHPCASRESIEAFVTRWKASGAAERANCQLFLAELCDLLHTPRPEPATPHDGDNAYVFERNVTFNNGDGTTSPGRIDLYKRGCFVLEAKQGADKGEGPTRCPQRARQAWPNVVKAPPCVIRRAGKWR